MQDKRQGEEDERVVAKARVARNMIVLTPGILCCRVQAPLSKAGEFKSKLFNLGVYRARGDPLRWIRTRATRQVPMCGTQIQTRTRAQEDELRDGKSEPPAEICFLTTLLEHAIQRMLTKSSQTCAGSLAARPKDDTLDQIDTPTVQYGEYS